MNKAFGGDSSLGGRIRKRLSGKELDSRSYHSISYHRYFEGYREREIRDLRGKKRIIRSYAGPVYRQELDQGGRILVRVGYLLLLALAVFMMIRVGMLDRAGDRNAVIILAEMVTILSLSLLGFNLLVNYLFASGKMTIGEYRSGSKALIRWAGIAAAGFGLDALLTAGYWAVTRPADGTREIQAVILFLAGAAAVGLIALLEYKVPYTCILPEESGEEDQGTEILYR